VPGPIPEGTVGRLEDHPLEFGLRVLGCSFDGGRFVVPQRPPAEEQACGEHGAPAGEAAAAGQQDSWAPIVAGVSQAVLEEMTARMHAMFSECTTAQQTKHDTMQKHIDTNHANTTSQLQSLSNREDTTAKQLQELTTQSGVVALIKHVVFEHDFDDRVSNMSCTTDPTNFGIMDVKAIARIVIVQKLIQGAQPAAPGAARPLKLGGNLTKEECRVVKHLGFMKYHLRHDLHIPLEQIHINRTSKTGKHNVGDKPPSLHLTVMHENARSFESDRHVGELINDFERQRCGCAVINKTWRAC
ncbi:unnamed protein product, partial [Prorocentrum cordatum]